MPLTNLVFIEKLGLSSKQKGNVVVPCPFHGDSNPSLSINLTRAVWYCFGGCDDPKGGGPVEFLQKWIKIKEGKELTYQAARMMLTGGRSVRSAQWHKTRLEEEELRGFLEYGPLKVASLARLMERHPKASKEDVDWLDWVLTNLLTVRADDSEAAKKIYQTMVEEELWVRGEGLKLWNADNPRKEAILQTLQLKAKHVEEEFGCRDKPEPHGFTPSLDKPGMPETTASRTTRKELKRQPVL